MTERIVTRPATEEYRVGWDRVFGNVKAEPRKTPREYPRGRGFKWSNAALKAGGER